MVFRSDEGAANRIADRILEQQKNIRNPLVDDPVVRMLVQALAERVAEQEAEASRQGADALASLSRRLMPRWQGPIPSSTVFSCAAFDDEVEIDAVQCRVSPTVSMLRPEYHPLTDTILRKGGVSQVFRLQPGAGSVVEVNCGTDSTGPTREKGYLVRPGARAGKAWIVLKLQGDWLSGEQLFVEAPDSLLEAMRHGAWHFCTGGRASASQRPEPVGRVVSGPGHRGELGGNFGLSPLAYPSVIAARYARNVFGLDFLGHYRVPDAELIRVLPGPIAELVCQDPGSSWIWIELETDSFAAESPYHFGIYRNWFMAADLRLRNFPHGAKGAVLPGSGRTIRLGEDREFDRETFFNLLKVRTWETRNGRSVMRAWQGNWNPGRGSAPGFDVRWMDGGIDVILDPGELPLAPDRLDGYQVTYAMTAGEKCNGIGRGELTQFTDKAYDRNCAIFNIVQTDGGRPPLAEGAAAELTDNWIRTGYRPLSPWDVTQLLESLYRDCFSRVTVRWSPVRDGCRLVSGMIVEGQVKPGVDAGRIKGECQGLVEAVLGAPLQVHCRILESGHGYR